MAWSTYSALQQTSVGRVRDTVKIVVVCTQRTCLYVNFSTHFFVPVMWAKGGDQETKQGEPKNTMCMVVWIVYLVR